MKKQTIKKEDPFKFLKEGHDSQFEKAMNSIGVMYDDIFKSDVQLDSIFEGLRVENNPTLEPIKQMFDQIFEPEAVKDKRQFIKVEGSKQKNAQYGLQNMDDDEQESIVVGQPVYYNYDETIWNKDL